MKISRTATGFTIESLDVDGVITGSLAAVGPNYRIDVFLNEQQFRRLVTLGAELLMSAPECAFIEG